IGRVRDPYSHSWARLLQWNDDDKLLHQHPVAALVLPISNRPRVTSSCAGKIGLREPGEHTSGPNLASRDNVAHNQNLYTILETLPPVIPLCRKQAQLSDGRMLFGVPRMLAQSSGAAAGRQADR